MDAMMAGATENREIEAGGRTAAANRTAAGRLLRIAAITATGALLCAAAMPARSLAETAGKPPACTAEPIGSAAIRAATDGRVLELMDGRRVRLGGLDMPASADEAALAQARLQAMAGRTVRLARLAPDDRYGRTVALVYLAEDESPIQDLLLESGLVRVGIRTGDWPCARRLLAAERKARLAGRGLWGSPAGAVRRADKPQALRADLGRLVLVEGRIFSARTVGGITYLNFSRRWSEGFTAVIFKRNLNAFAEAGITVQTLARRTVTVRGILEQRNGLQMELLGPAQIEISEL